MSKDRESRPVGSEMGPPQDARSLAMVPRRVMVLGVILMVGIGAALYLLNLRTKPTPSAHMARAAIPGVIKDGGRVWTALDSELSDRELEILETRDYVFRTYLDNAGGAVALCIVFSQDNRKGTHPPDVCLEGNGSRIVARYERAVKLSGGETVEVREIVSRFNNQLQYFSYFYKVGDLYTPSFYSQQGKIIWLGLTNRSAASALVRYSTGMEGGGEEDLKKARGRVDELLAATYPYIQKMGESRD